MILKEKQRKALCEVACLGQRSSLLFRPTRAERKAAKWAGRVLREQKRIHNVNPGLARKLDPNSSPAYPRYLP